MKGCKIIRHVTYTCDGKEFHKKSAAKRHKRAEIKKKMRKRKK